MKTSTTILALVLIAAPTLRAQLVADGATNILSNVTNNPSNVTVGTNGSFTLLVLSNNALLNNTANGVIGRNASAQSNEVRVTGATARWNMAAFANLFVGSNGAASRLTINGGGKMQNFFNCNVGFNFSSSNNSVLVTDPGSLWSGSILFITGGGGNQLTVSNGATAWAGGTTVGLGTVASNNLVTVTGAGSLWTNDTGFSFGSSGNRVIVNAGGRLANINATVGLDSTANYNTVLLTDSGSSWTNSGDIRVGDGGTGNQVIASNGAAIYVGGTALVGFNSPGSSNALILADAGTHFFKGLNTDIKIGSNSPFNRLVISNGATADCRIGELGFNTNGDANEAIVTGLGSAWRMTLDTIVGRNGAGNRLTISDSALVSSLQGVLGLNAGGANNLAIVTGPGSMWTNVNSLTIGDQGSGNRLVVNNGAAVFANGDGTIGGNPSARSNSVVVTDAGTSFTVASAHLFVGRNGPFNQLIITNGARVMNSVGSSSMGDSPDGSNNLALVTGPGSLLTNRISLYVGAASDANRLVVTNGAQVQGRYGTIGLNFNRNEAVVTGAGSLWNNGEELVVGASANGSRLVVSDGGTVAAGTNVILGRFDFGSLGNRATVDGGTLKVTNASATGTLDIRRGTNVFNAGLIDVDQLVMTNRGVNPSPTTFGSSGGFINIPSGSPASPYPSSIAVSGLSGNVTGVTVQLFLLSHTFPDDLDIVLLSPGGQKVMLMSDAGSDTSADAISNVNLTFSDAASTFLSDFTTIVSGTYRPTDYQPGETLPNPAPPGPYSTSLSSFIGGSPNGTWRLCINDDANPDSGSLGGWAVSITTDADPTRAGVFEFNGGTLVTRGAVINNNLSFAVGASGINPAVWDVRPGASDHRVFGDLIVGENSSFNQLLLTNGALLTNSSAAILGRSAGANSNSVILAGAGSRWVVDDGVFVGRFGSANRLVISNGASLVTASSSLLGNEFLSTNNEAVVTGPGSSWLNGPGQMFVGYGGRANRLLVSDGGLVASSFGTIGNSFADSSNNLAVVTGAGSVWSNTFELRVGNAGAANQLVVSNGGAVFASNAVFVGFDPASLRNRLVVDGGTLRAINASADGTLDVRRGTNVLNAGLIDVDILRMTNTLGLFEFNGGTLQTRNTTVSNGRAFLVGTGTSAATLRLQGGTHAFANQLLIAGNSSLVGNGTVFATLIVFVGGNLSPGASVGRISLSTPPFLSGTVLMEISKNGAVLTNDQLQVTGTLTYGGALTVTNIGPTALAAGDRFPLFSASSYGGSFSVLNLPQPGPGLNWTNKLLLDGSIEVVTSSGPKIGSVAVSGTNLSFSVTDGIPGGAYDVLTATNIVTPLTNWVTLSSGAFDLFGNTTVTNSIALAESQRYFRIRIP